MLMQQCLQPPPQRQVNFKGKISPELRSFHGYGHQEPTHYPVLIVAEYCLLLLPALPVIVYIL